MTLVHAESFMRRYKCTYQFFPRSVSFAGVLLIQHVSGREVRLAQDYFFGMSQEEFLRVLSELANHR